MSDENKTPAPQSPIDCQLASVQVHIESYTSSIKQREASPDRDSVGARRVLAEEKRSLGQLEAEKVRLTELKAKLATEQPPASPAVVKQTPK